LKHENGAIQPHYYIPGGAISSPHEYTKNLQRIISDVQELDVIRVMPIIQRINIVHARRKSIEQNEIGDIILHAKISRSKKKEQSPKIKN
jgi:hypothetical protein